MRKRRCENRSRGQRVLALIMEEGPQPRGEQANSGSWKRQGKECPMESQKDHGPAQHLGFRTSDL